MSEQKLKENIFTSPNTTVTTSAVFSHAIEPRQRIAQNFVLMWMDANIDRSNIDCQNTLAQLQSIVNNVNIFTQQDDCIDFLTEINDTKVFLIVEGTLGQHIVPLIHDIAQLGTIYIFCNYKRQHEQWTKEWTKIKGVHTEITSICESLQRTIKQCNQDSIVVSFVEVTEETSDINFDQLEPPFMYTQIFKEILLDMEYDRQSIEEFITYCRNGDYGPPSSIARFANEYHAKSAIWWYTFPSFIYSMLNSALRTLKGDTIITMGFFIRDLHQQIEELHQQQIESYHGKSFTVYRGQGLLKTNFEKLLKTKGGLMSFNNFLSTSNDREVSLRFAEGALTNMDMVGILFKMTVDPSRSSTPFASIREISYYQMEEEILFSMHTIFRIGEITKIDNNSLLYQVELQLTSDDDQQLRTLTEHIREEVGADIGWKRLGLLLIKIGQFDKAEEVYKVLLEQTTEDEEKETYYNNLGFIKNQQGAYKEAITYHEKRLEISKQTLPPGHSDLATTYNNIGSVYTKMGEYSTALSFYEKGIDILEKTRLPNHYSLATPYNNIGSLYESMGEYWKALQFYEKTLVILEKNLPSNHPVLAGFYINIGLLYKNVGEYSKALPFHEKGIEICEKTLPSDHPWLATSYGNVAAVYYDLAQYEKALSFYEKDLEICRKTLPLHHQAIVICYNNIALVYMNMGQNSKALAFAEKANEICQKILSPNHLDLATSYNNIALVYMNMGENTKALSLYEKALEICQKTLPSHHPLLATCYGNIAGVYYDMEEYEKALSFDEISLEIKQKTLPPNHPDLAISYNNIAGVYYNVRECWKALSYLERAQKIWQHSLPSNHPQLRNVREKIETVKKML